MTGMSNPMKMLFSQNELIDVAISTMPLIENKKIINDQRLIEVFLFGIKKRFRKDVWRESYQRILYLPTSHQVTVDFTKPMFTDKQQAHNYGRFLPNSFCMIKGYAVDRAIESKDNQLYLRSDYLQNDMIHGFYPSATDLRVYIKNPEFDEEFLKKETVILA